MTILTDERGRTIIDSDIQFASVYTEEEDGSVSSISDPSRIVAADFTTIPSDCCIICKQHRDPYSEEFLSWQGFGMNYLRFNYQNGYCQKCAEDQAEKSAYKGDKSGIKSERITETKYGTNHVIVFEDGEVFEEEKRAQGMWE